MRHLFLVILLLLFSNFSAQSKIAVKKNTKGDQPFYRIKPSDHFYIGVENPFILYKDPSKKYSVKVQNGIILKEDTSSKDSSIYYIDVKNTNPTFVYVSVNAQTYAYKFRNRKIPSPIITLYAGNEWLKGGDVKAKDFSQAETVVLNLSSFDYPCGFTIVGMELTKISNGETKNYLLTDNKIGDQTKFCAPGDIYIFSKVVIEFIGTKDQRTIEGSTFFIK